MKNKLFYILISVPILSAIALLLLGELVDAPACTLLSMGSALLGLIPAYILGITHK